LTSVYISIKIYILWHELESLPVLDERAADEILGYDDAGLPR
jgi:hypothetical protein